MATGTLTTLSDTAGAGKLRRISIQCVSDASGVVTSDAIAGINGIVAFVETVPDTTDVPTAYNLQLRRGSSSGYDMLGGSGSGRSTTAREECRPQDAGGNQVISAIRGENLYLTADSVGNAKKFTANIFILQE